MVVKYHVPNKPFIFNKWVILTLALLLSFFTVISINTVSFSRLDNLNTLVFFEHSHLRSKNNHSSPSNTATKYSIMSNHIPDHVELAVSTLVLNQGMYLREWIEFHKLMGFQLFLIFDDNSTDNTVEVLREYITGGVVLLVHAKTSFASSCSVIRRDPNVHHIQSSCQKTVFNYALNLFRGKVKWAGNFDVDEFLWTTNAAITPSWMPLPELLNSRYAEYDAIDIISIVFGTSNLSVPDDRLVVSKLTHRALAGKYPRFTPYDGNRFGRKALYRPDRIWYVDIHSAKCFIFCHTAYVYPLADDLQMNHYQYKSFAEMEAKAIVNVNPPLKFNPEKEALLNEVEDLRIQFIIPKLMERLKNKLA
jgi:hypothetical protein